MTPQWPLTVTNHPPLHHISHKLSENIQYMGSNSRKRKRPLYPPFSDTVPGPPPNPKLSQLEPEPDRIWTLNRSHITGSGLPDSVDPAQYQDKNPDIQL